MSKQSGYKKQKNLSAIQLLSEAPTFIANLLSAIFSGTLLIYVDLLDSLSYIIRNAMVLLLSGKLSKDLRFEYNYGIGKIEAVCSLLCDGIVLSGMFLTACLSVYSFFHPSRPSDLLITVAGLKFYDLMWDYAFFNKQRKILKENNSAICRTNYAAALGTLLFESFTFAGLLLMWLFRKTPVGGYISPAVSFLVSVYLAVGCVKRIKNAYNEITDRTLPEEQQLKILNVLNRHYDNYSQFHFVNSQKSGEFIRIDLHLSFENNTTPEDIVALKEQMKAEFDTELGNCIVNIVVERDQTA